MGTNRRDNSISAEHVIDLISPYLDNALEADERERVRAHIATCEVCATEWRELQATQQMLRAVPVQVPPHVFTLTPEMVGAKSRAEAAPSLLSRLFGRALAPRLATGSVLAFTLLLVILVSDLGVLGRRELSVASAPSAKLAAGSTTAAPAEQYAMAEPTATTALGDVSVMVAPSVAPPTDSGGGAGAPAGGSDQSNTAPPQATVVAEAAEATATTGAEAPVEGPIADAPTAQAAAGSQPTEAQAEGTSVALYNRQAPANAYGDESNPAPVAQSPNPGGTAMPVTLLIELGLALLGVGLAIGAIVAMRRNA
ncbi:MAG: putative zinc-finger [Chloroflexia bacterium]|jgi:anti-sigma factor RsiW|nr:putative zinc-finger [Chloroflexia bacterium]